MKYQSKNVTEVLSTGSSPSVGPPRLPHSVLKDGWHAEPKFNRWGDSGNAWSNDELARWYTPVNYDQCAPFANERYGWRLKEFDDAVKEIAASSHPIYRPGVGSSGQHVWKRTPLSKYFGQLKGFMSLNMAGYPQTEHIRLFFKHLYALGLQDIYFTRPSAPTSLPADPNVPNLIADESPGLFKMQAEVCNDFAYALQLEARTQAFKDRVAATDQNAFELVLIRESQLIKALQKEQKTISEKRQAFLREQFEIYPGVSTDFAAEVTISSQSSVQLQLNRFAIAQLKNATKLIARQLVIASARHSTLTVRI